MKYQTLVNSTTYVISIQLQLMLTEPSLARAKAREGFDEWNYLRFVRRYCFIFCVATPLSMAHLLIVFIKVYESVATNRLGANMFTGRREMDFVAKSI